MRLIEGLLLSILFFSSTLFAQTADEPVIWKNNVEVLGNKIELEFKATILKTWHLYGVEEFDQGPLPTEFVFEIDSTKIKPLGVVVGNEPKVEYDEIFEIDLPFYEDFARFTQTFELLDSSVTEISGEILYQACDDKVCIFRSEPFTISLNDLTVSKKRIGISEEDRAKSKALLLDLKNTAYLDTNVLANTSESPLISLFLLGFLGGVIALLTPCVFPMIPLTVSFFIKQASSLRKGIANAVLYGFFIVLIYVLLSLPFHFLDAVNPEFLNSISTNVVLNLVFFGVFVFFAFSFFGFYELTLPSKWSSGADEKSNLKGIVGIFFMALTLAIVSFSCTGPILGSLLAGSLTAEGGAMQLTAGMTGFGVALALPFALFALFPNALNSMPKSGGWMTTIKVTLGFLELALALKFLSNADLVSHWGFLKREVFIGVWALLAFLLTLYLLGVFRFPNEVKPRLSKLRLILLPLTIGLTSYLFLGLVSAENKLTLLSGFPPPAFYSIFKTDSDCPLGLDCYKNVEDGLAVAKSKDKAVLFDFTGWACVNCRKVEENVWPVPEIFKLLNEEIVLISLYVDDRTELSMDRQFVFEYPDGRVREINTVGELWGTFQSLNFSSASQPFYVLMEADGTLLNSPIQYTDSSTYLSWLEKGLSNRVK